MELTGADSVLASKNEELVAPSDEDIQEVRNLTLYHPMSGMPFHLHISSYFYMLWAEHRTVVQASFPEKSGFESPCNIAS
jgi:hypothetical protein